MLAKFAEKWMTPTGLVIVIGFVIWLAQLNWHALQSTEKNAEQDLIQREILAKQVVVSRNVQKSALLLSILVNEMKDLKAKVEDHNAEAEKWKEKIRHLENDS